MHKFFSVAALAVVSMLLDGCGGSAFSSSGTTTTTGAAVASIAVTSDTATVPSDGSSGANISVVAKDANNAAVSGAVIAFTADNGGTVTATQGTTDATGTAKATLAVGTAAAGATITVTAASGQATGKAAVTVANTKKTLTILTSAPQIPSDSSTGATISAIVKDSNNNLLAGVPVAFQVTSGAVAPVKTAAGGIAGITAGTTDANGLAQALVTTPGDPTNRTITLNAAAGTATGQVNVAVTGTTLTLTGPSNLVLSNTGTCSVVLSNSAGQGIGNTAVTLTSASGNTLSAANVVTDGNGRASFTVKGSVGGTDTITATALGLTQKLSIAVSTQSFNITAPAAGTKVSLGATQAVTLTWINNGAPVANQPVTFATTRGTLVPATPVTTDANGVATVSISSTTSGPSIVQATGSGVSAQLNIDFVAMNPSQISVQAGPTAVAIQGQSTITALVRDAANNLVEGATINFQVVTDPTNGGLATASAVTDAQGRAQAVYTAGNTSSGANGVTVSATVATTTITGSAQLTVGGQAVGLSFGTGNTVDVAQGVAVYQVTYTVFAVDSHGAALPNQPISISVLPVAYGKGVMGGCPGGTGWAPVYSTATTDPFAYRGAKMCTNEDTDYTGNLNSLGLNASGKPIKDYNLNNTLDPGNVAVASPTSGTTDAAGRLDVKVTYPRDHAYWTEVTLVASTTVQGTQSSTSATFVLIGAISDYSCSVGPPGATSPYGIANTCANSN